MDGYLGKKVKYDVINSYGVTLVPAQTILGHEHIKLLVKHDIDTYSIVILKEIEEEKTSCSQCVQQAVDLSRELIDSFRTSRKIPVMEIRKEILPSIRQVAENPDIFQLFETVKAKDDYTYQHNIGVGILSTLIGRWLNLGESELTLLSLAATLHDIGKVNVPLDILNKPGKLTNEEFALVKKHTIFGYEMLRDTTGLNSRIALVALQHHERNDGKGYPFGLKQEKIDYFGKIVAVADIFHAMSSKRPYHEPMPFYEIVSQMRQGIFGALDPNIVSVFLENIVKKMVGQNVVLTDGRVGEVVHLNPHNIETPLIKIKDEFLDLSILSDLHIKEISI
ncbi:HD-GYP domain-containing protein [Paenibacillus frigoriresistens]|uniref:HD-GYP domain-containing protein n=1 Tax=Paenibacillus alginolyticus TaxID=59839 RepID=UPI00156727D7|nr:HD-GYP domain-containing protein [Paenibacillus frigoriresistens]NRF95562.1 HD-GYP domain-containing protein [Paenibacillus frigoriresistens]